MTFDYSFEDYSETQINDRVEKSNPLGISFEKWNKVSFWKRELDKVRHSPK